MTSNDDPLEDPALPRLGLSLSVLLAIAIGGALGTVARFLLDTAFVEGSASLPHCHVGRQPQRIPGHRAPGSARSALGTSTAAAPPVPHRRFPRRLDDVLGTGCQCRHPAPERAGRVELAVSGGDIRRRNGARRAGQCDGSTMGADVTGAPRHHSRRRVDAPLPHPGSRVVGRRRWRDRRGAARTDHPPRRSSSPRPVAGRHAGRQCLRVPAPGLPHGPLDVPRVRSARSRCGRHRLVRGLHHLVHRQLGIGPSLSRRPPLRGVGLHLRRTRALSRSCRRRYRPRRNCLRAIFERDRPDCGARDDGLTGRSFPTSA